MDIPRHATISIWLLAPLSTWGPLGFEWVGTFCTFYCVDALPRVCPLLFTPVMGHSARVLRYTESDLLVYLGDVVCGCADTSDHQAIFQEFGSSATSA